MAPEMTKPARKPRTSGRRCSEASGAEGKGSAAAFCSRPVPTRSGTIDAGSADGWRAASCACNRRFRVSTASAAAVASAASLAAASMRSTRRGPVVGGASLAVTPAKAALRELMGVVSRRSAAIFSASLRRRGWGGSWGAILSMANAGKLDILASTLQLCLPNPVGLPGPASRRPVRVLAQVADPLSRRGGFAHRLGLLLGQAGDAIEQSKPAALLRYVAPFGHFCGRGCRRLAWADHLPAVERWSRRAVERARLGRVGLFGATARAR